MEHTIILNDQEVEVLKTIFAKIAPMPLIVTPVSKPKKLSRAEQAILDMQAYKLNKASKKSK